MIVEVWLLLVMAVLAAWAYSRWRHSYWSARGVTTPPYLPFFGHLHKFLIQRKLPWLVDNEIYRHSGSYIVGKYDFLTPTLMIGDPDLMKHILVKDFDHFTDRRIFKFYNTETDTLMGEMLSLKQGEEWKNLRSVMTPTFTSGKMRGMFPLVCEKADNLVSFSLKEAAKNPYVDMKHNFGRFTMDTIASCAFGIECNSLENVNAEFPKTASTFFDFNMKKMLKFMFMTTFPKLSKLLQLRFNPPELDTFVDVINETVAVREKGHKRGDFLDLLLEARTDVDNPNRKQVLDNKSLVAQSVLFLVAGYDTTASTLAFSSYLLAKNPTQQQRLRQELQKIVKEHGGLTYEGIMEAKFLDACVMETLRLYPPAPATERKCTKTYQLPGTDLIVEKGLILQFPIWSIHHDPKYWPQPEEFLPDRFLPENRDNITSFTHLPFGMGPRNCIALRFALMEVKLALGKMILAADLQLAPGHQELQLEFGFGVIRPKNGINLVLVPLCEE